MPSWICKWPNGSLTLVSAENVDDALYMLDELGDARKSYLKPYRHGFLVDIDPIGVRRGGYFNLSLDEGSSADALEHFDKNAGARRKMEKDIEARRAKREA